MAQEIGRGSSGPSVKKIQKMLNKSGVLKTKLKEDSDYSIKTEDAVRVFQKRNKLNDNGYVDSLTLQALMAMQQSAQRDLKDVQGVKRHKLNDKQQQKVRALQGKTTDTKAMRGNADKLERYFDQYEKYLLAWNKQLATVGDDAQLANIDLQNMLQKSQQTLQMMSNVSKMLHDTSMSIIRKIG